LGLDFDVVTIIIGLITGSPNARKKYQSQPIHSEVLPNDFHADCLIADRTPTIQSAINMGPKDIDPADGSRFNELSHTENVGYRNTEWHDLLKNHANLNKSNLKHSILLVDCPDQVPYNKSLEHETRRTLPYTEDELRARGILDEEDGYGYFTEDFATKSIWGQRQRLWSTSLTKAAIGRFWIRCDFEALIKLNLDDAPNPNRPIDFIIDGPWNPYQNTATAPGAFISFGSLGEGRKEEKSNKPLDCSKSLHPLICSTAGEADLKIKYYLNSKYGRNFLIRSDDGDLICIVLLHLWCLFLAEKDKSGLSFNEDKFFAEELPIVWLDRTAGYSVNSSTNPKVMAFRNVNVSALFIEIVKSNLSVVATVGAILLRGCDYVIPFGKIFTVTHSANELLDPSIPKKTAPPHFSAARVANLIFTQPSWHSKCFSSAYDRNRDILTISCDYKVLTDAFAVVYPTINSKSRTFAYGSDIITLHTDKGIVRKEGPPKNVLKGNVKRLLLTMDYWANAPSRILHQATHNPDGKLPPYTHYALQCDPKTKANLHGWQLVPCSKKQENSTTVFRISKEDRDLWADRIRIGPPLEEGGKAVLLTPAPPPPPLTTTTIDLTEEEEEGDDNCYFRVVYYD
jgi:hypothetical protein